MMINLLSCFNLSLSSPLMRNECFHGWTMDDFDQLVGYKDVFDGEFDPSNSNPDDVIEFDSLLTE